MLSALFLRHGAGLATLRDRGQPMNTGLSRRRFLKSSLGGTLALASVAAQAKDGEGRTCQATGVKVGEVSDSSAIAWMRLTAEARRRADGFIPKAGVLPKGARPEEARFACPGMAGRVRLRYS